MCHRVSLIPFGFASFALNAVSEDYNTLKGGIERWQGRRKWKQMVALISFKAEFDLRSRGNC